MYMPLIGTIQAIHAHPVMRMSRGLTLQNVANSIMNSTVGMRNSAVACVAGFIGDNALI